MDGGSAMTTVVPLITALVKRALRHAGASDTDIHYAMACYSRAREAGDSTLDAAAWALRFYYLSETATAPRGMAMMAKRSVRIAYAQVISDRALLKAATTPPRKPNRAAPRGAA